MLHYGARSQALLASRACRFEHIAAFQQNDACTICPLRATKYAVRTVCTSHHCPIRPQITSQPLTTVTDNEHKLSWTMFVYVEVITGASGDTHQRLDARKATRMRDGVGPFKSDGPAAGDRSSQQRVRAATRLPQSYVLRWLRHRNPASGSASGCLAWLEKKQRSVDP